MPIIDEWDKLDDVDRKILTLAGVTEEKIREARKNWYGTTYPYDIKVDKDADWIRGRFTQAEVSEMYHFAYRIRNMGGFGIPKEDLPLNVVTAENFEVKEGELVFVPTPIPENIEDKEAKNVLARKVLELEERVEKLESC